jgi:hypothetical protein
MKTPAAQDGFTAGLPVVQPLPGTEWLALQVPQPVTHINLPWP